MTGALPIVAAIVSILGAPAAAQEPFLDYDFETGGLEDFFLPIGVDLCGTPLPTGTAEIDGGEVVLTTDEAFGIGMFSLLPEVVGEKFPDNRDIKIRTKFMFDAAGQGGPVTQFMCAIRGRGGVDETTGVLDSAHSVVYYISVVPEFVVPELMDGFIAIQEFDSCHEDIEHPDWPLGDGYGAAPPGGFAIVREEWYWLEVTAIGDDDGGPVTLSAALWPDGDEPPATPQLTVVDQNGLPHRPDTLAAETDLGVFYGLNFDIEPRPFGGTARIDEFSVTQVGGCGERPATMTRSLWGDPVQAEGRPASLYEDGAEYEVRLAITDVRQEGACGPAGQVTVVERIPDGWEASAISHDGAFANGAITWSLDLGAGVPTLTYKVVAAGNGLGAFQGEFGDTGGDRVFFVDGTSQAVDVASLAPISDFGSIQHWLILGPFNQSGGNNPGDTEILRDYLTDGDVTEATIAPEAGDTIVPDYNGDAASTGLRPNSMGRNPEDVPTWIAWHDLDDDDDRIDFESLYGDVDNVMCYALTYVDVEDEETVNFGISSDDSIHVLLDGETLHAHSEGRGALPRTYQDLPSAYENLREVVLTAGRHTLLVKVFEGGGDHNFRVGFVDDFDAEIPGGPEGISISIEPLTVEEKIRFRRGDANDDGTVNIADGVFVLNFLFTDIVSEVPCEESSDANDDGGINISDGLYILNYLFVGGGAAPPAPGPDTCGENPEDEDMTGCVYTSC